MTELEQIEAVKKGSAIIQTFDNPSEAVQLAAVQTGGKSIRFIDNPSEAVQLAAVTQNGRAIYYIQNPSEKVKKAAITANPLSIDKIKDASDELQLLALSTGAALHHIKNPTWNAILYGITNNASYVKSYPNLSYKQYVLLYQANAQVLKYLDNPIIIDALSRIKNFEEPTDVEVQSLKFHMSVESIFEYLEETVYINQASIIRKLLEI